ncbi:MAG: hypothetical protein O8C64_09750 [Candidatus Methanoperedens sp.]|nr:hypothetical protein [Candidatus Methanoperedens sp.]MCZ7403391.1 hypothetical protein [Candidatus Methanoperedens sp.]
MVIEDPGKAIFLNDSRDITMVELGRDDVTVSLTPGKIILWFGRQVSESLIRDVIFGISGIDSTVNHEQEVICDFSTIPEYENMGYVLTSYARTKGGYRAIFNVPFSKKSALAHFVKSIVNQLKEKDVKKTLFWDGSFDRIILIFNELKKLDGWELKRIEHKEEEKGV